jgi:hypothetical protein
VFSVGGISLVDYSDSDETSSDCWKDQPMTPHIDEVKEKLNDTRKIPVCLSLKENKMLMVHLSKTNSLVFLSLSF